MPTTITIKVAGLQELGERMRALNTKVATKASVRCTGAMGGVVKRAAKSNLKRSPSIDTGALEKAVILKKIPKSRTKLTSEHVVVVKSVPYKEDSQGGTRTTRRVAGYVERGTVHMQAEPFLGPALSQNIGAAIEAGKQRLADEIFKAGG